MDNSSSRNLLDLVQSLEHVLDRLVAENESLKREIQELKQQANQWSGERALLHEKAMSANNRVDAMINRLKSMGHE